MGTTNVGGYLRGPWWNYTGDDETKTRRCFVIAWGNIVMQPTDSFKETRAVKFVIKTGRGAGRSEKHLVCMGYGEMISTTVMRAMEKGDVVFVAGTWVEKLKSKTKKGIKPTYEMQVHFIIPQGLIGFLLDLYSTPTITGAVEARQNEDADVWESDY